MAPKLKKMEPHSPYELKRALFKSNMYRDIVRKMRLNCIGLILSPPLMLTINPDKTTMKKKKGRTRVGGTNDSI